MGADTVTCTCAGPFAGYSQHEDPCQRDEAELAELEWREALVDRLLRAFGVEPEGAA